MFSFHHVHAITLFSLYVPLSVEKYKHDLYIYIYKKKRQKMTNIGVKYELHQVLSVGLLRPAFLRSLCSDSSGLVHSC